MEEGKVKDALNEALWVLSFNDSSDFRGALWNIIRILDEDIYDCAVEDIDSALEILNPSADDYLR